MCCYASRISGHAMSCPSAKIEHPTRDDALEAQKRLVWSNRSRGTDEKSAGLNVYPCEHCGAWHVGHSRRQTPLVYHYDHFVAHHGILYFDALVPQTAEADAQRRRPADDAGRPRGRGHDVVHVGEPLGSLVPATPCRQCWPAAFSTSSCVVRSGSSTRSKRPIPAATIAAGGGFVTRDTDLQVRTAELPPGPGVLAPGDLDFELASARYESADRRFSC